MPLLQGSFLIHKWRAIKLGWGVRVEWQPGGVKEAMDGTGKQRTLDGKEDFRLDLRPTAAPNR